MRPRGLSAGYGDLRSERVGRASGLAAALALAWLVLGCSRPPDTPMAYSTPTDDPALPDNIAVGKVAGVEPRFNGPGLSSNATQTEKGELVYWGICMACHGDRGQGLTDEWRDAWGEDKSCWASKCHAANHPPQGFELPKTVPAILGPGTMARFEDARALHEYIADTMPWWSPGSLTPQQGLGVTAYLLQERDALPPGTALSEANLSAFDPLHQVRQRRFERPAVLAGFGLLVISGSALAVAFWTRRGR